MSSHKDSAFAFFEELESDLVEKQQSLFNDLKNIEYRKKEKKEEIFTKKSVIPTLKKLTRKHNADVQEFKAEDHQCFLFGSRRIPDFIITHPKFSVAGEVKIGHGFKTSIGQAILYQGITAREGGRARFDYSLILFISVRDKSRFDKNVKSFTKRLWYHDSIYLISIDGHNELFSNLIQP